jgi:hypothetical protein
MAPARRRILTEMRPAAGNDGVSGKGDDLHNRAPVGGAEAPTIQISLVGVRPLVQTRQAHREVGDVKRRTPEVTSDPAGHASPVTPGTLGTESPEETGDRAVGRRALLTRGGVVVAGVVGAGVAGAAIAAPASATTGQPIVQGASNDAGTDPAATTEILATNNTAPTPSLTLTNPGSRVVNTLTEGTPPLRLTQSAAPNPSSAGAGGDMVATSDGNLWFTHAPPSVTPFPATVHTDANSNSFVPLAAPQRILDTRTSAGRANVLDPSGKFDSAGRLLAGMTIHIDLTTLVFFGDAVTSNLTVTGSLKGGYLTLWSGAGSRPGTSSINFATGQTIANLTVSGIAEFPATSPTVTDTIGIFASVTTQVILDVAGFAVGNIGQVNPAFAAPTMSRSARAQRAKQALAKLRTQKG